MATGKGNFEGLGKNCRKYCGGNRSKGMLVNKKKLHLNLDEAFEVGSGFEPLYKVLQTFA